MAEVLTILVDIFLQGMDFGSNAKTNDANINDFLYSGDDRVGSGYQLPQDPGSQNAYMR